MLRDNAPVGLWILYVCTGNVCRSPMAEFLLREAADQGGDLHVSSAGTGALVGSRMDHGSAAVLSELGIDPSAHRGRQFQGWMAMGADLVLTAGLAHREAVVAEEPSALRRTFTMKEFARLLPHTGSGSPSELIARAAHIRGMYGAVPRELDEVPDPYRAGVLRAKDTARQIFGTIKPLVDAFGLAATEQGGGRRPEPRPLPHRFPA